MKKRWLIVGGIVVSWAFVMHLFSNPQLSGSSHYISPQGTKAFYTLLERLKVPVGRWKQPLKNLPANQSGATLLLVTPSEPVLTARGSSRGHMLREWIDRGNRLIYFRSPGTTDETLLADLGVEPLISILSAFDVGNGDESVHCSVPGICDNVRILNPLKRTATVTSKEAEIIAGTWQEASIVRTRIGKGEAWIIGTGDIISNQFIDHADNLRFLFQLVTANAGKPVWFDEYHHGFLEPVAAARLGSYQSLYIFALWLLFATLLTMLSLGVREGRFAPEPGITFPPTSDFARALGSMYHKHEATDVLAGFCRAWRERLDRQMGFGRYESHAEIGERLLLQGMSKSACAEVVTALEALENGKDRGARVMEEYRVALENALKLREKGKGQ